MDPLTITTATLQFLGIAQKVYNYAKEAKNAKETIGQLASQTHAMRDNIVAFRAYCEQNKNKNGLQMESFRVFYQVGANGDLEEGEVLQSFNRLADQLDSKLKDPAEGQNASSSKPRPNSYLRLQRYARQVRWAFAKQGVEEKIKNMKELQSQINIVKTEMMQDLFFLRESRGTYTEIMNWLSPRSFQDDQQHHSDNSYLGPTIPSDWLINDTVFQAWLDGQRWRLCIYGEPGSGKTILTSHIVSYLQKRELSGQDQHATLFLYLRSSLQEEQTWQALCALLLKQVVAYHGQDRIPRRVQQIYNDAVRKSASRPAAVDTFEILEEELRSLGRTYIVVDGLDEATDKTREDLMRGLQKLLDQSNKAEKGNISLLYTSRRLVGQAAPRPTACKGIVNGRPCSEENLRMYWVCKIHRSHGRDYYLCEACRNTGAPEMSPPCTFEQPDEVNIDLRPSRDSIERYVRALQGEAMQGKPGGPSSSSVGLNSESSDTEDDSDEALWSTSIAQILKGNPSLARKIVDDIVDRSQNLYILAGMQWEHVRESTSPNEVLEALKTLPQKLEESYDFNMQRMQGQSVTQKRAKQAHRVMMWVSQAMSGLSLRSLNYAMSIRPENFEPREPEAFDEGNKQLKNELMKLTRGMVTLYPDGMVHLAHRTAYEYFSTPEAQAKWFPDAQQYMTLSCLTALSFTDFQQPISGEKEDIFVEKRIKKFPFVGYASRHWGAHAQVCQLHPPVADLIKRFLALKGNLASSIQIAAIEEEKAQSKNWTERKNVNALHVAAWFGLDSVFEHLLSLGEFEVDTLDGTRYKRTALLHACRGRQHSAVEALLRLGADGNRRHNNGSTPLMHAAKSVDLWNANPAVSALCADSRIDVNAVTDRGRQTALMQAASMSHTPVLEALLKTEKIQVNLRDEYGATALTHAAYAGSLESVQALLSHKEIDINVRNNGDGFTPLHLAAFHGHDSIVHALLAKGADIDAKDNKGGTPLRRAMDRGHENTVEEFVKHAGLHDKSTDCEGRTLLFSACIHGHCEFIRRLLDARFDINSTDNNGQTPLHHAVLSGKAPAVRLLLENGAEKMVDANGQSAADLAKEKCDREILELLEGRPVDINDADLPATTLALRGASLALEARAGEMNSDICKPDSVGETPLAIAIYSRNPECARIILRAHDERGQSVDSISKSGRTPMHEAVDAGDLEMVQLLLAHDPNLDIRDIRGNTPLTAAAGWHNADMVIALLEAGSPVERGFRPPEHTMILAVETGKNEAVRKLIYEAGVPVETRHLQAANKHGNDEADRLLKKNRTFVRAATVRTATVPSSKELASPPALTPSTSESPTEEVLLLIRTPPIRPGPDTRKPKFRARESPLPA